MNTKNTKWTPGPWHLSDNCGIPPRYVGIFSKNGNWHAIAEVRGREEEARLITAAPEMAALLAQQLENIEGDLDWAEQEGDECAVGVHKARMEPIRAILARINGGSE